MDEVEKLAREACKADGFDPDAQLSAFSPPRWMLYEPYIREFVKTADALGYRRVDAGHVVVPREPTAEMVEAGMDTAQSVSLGRKYGMDGNEADFRSVYRAMLDALPTADPQPDQEPLTQCAAARDGECQHKNCPQARDGEPKTSGRSCPLPSFRYPTDDELVDDEPDQCEVCGGSGRVIHDDIYNCPACNKGE